MRENKELDAIKIKTSVHQTSFRENKGKPHIGENSCNTYI